ncbi:MAG: hypothetical protein CME70_20595 [Halobacteriovorax sp.]|nr:hypothetical protein [Halobacteriovorax sp.]
MKLLLDTNKIIIILLLMGLSSCGQTFNSNSNDANLTAFVACSEAGTAAGDRYCAAEAIIRNRCTGCHAPPGYHEAWSSYKNDAAWKASGLVVAGSVAASKMITRLKNQGGNMPADAPQISDAEYQTLVEWVQQMP